MYNPQAESLLVALIVKSLYIIFNYIEESDEYQFTLSELQQVIGDETCCPRTIRSKLVEHYGMKMLNFLQNLFLALAQ